MKVLLTRTEVAGKQIGEVADLPDGEAIGLIACGAAKAAPDEAQVAHAEAAVAAQAAPDEAPADPGACAVCGKHFKPSKLTEVEGIGLVCKACAAAPAPGGE